MGRSLSTVELRWYDHVPAIDARRARLHRVRWLAPGARGMTLGRHVLLVRGRESDLPLVAHELVHVRQFREHGPLPFLARYLFDYGRNLVRLRSHRRAYLAIPAEVEAREATAAWKATR